MNNGLKTSFGPDFFTAGGLGRLLVIKQSTSIKFPATVKFFKVQLTAGGAGTNSGPGAGSGGAISVIRNFPGKTYRFNLGKGGAFPPPGPQNAGQDSTVTCNGVILMRVTGGTAVNVAGTGVIGQILQIGGSAGSMGASPMGDAPASGAGVNPGTGGNGGKGADGAAWIELY